MNMTRRDKMLLLVMPALALFIGYATYGLSVWRTKFTTAEKGIAATRERIPKHEEEHRRQDKLAAARRESAGETEAIALLKSETATLAKTIAKEKQSLAEAKLVLSGNSHRDAMNQLRNQQTSVIKKLDDEFELSKKDAQLRHSAAIATLWAASNGPNADRTKRIEVLNKVLARFDLTVVDGTDDVKTEIAPPRLQAVMKTAVESQGLSPPKPRQIKIRGRYSEVAGALEAMSRGDAWAVPLGLMMKPVADGVFEWTLTVWV